MERPSEAPSMVQMDGKSVITEDSVNFNDLLVSDVVISIVAQRCTYLNKLWLRKVLFVPFLSHFNTISSQLRQENCWSFNEQSWLQCKLTWTSRSDAGPYFQSWNRKLTCPSGPEGADQSRTGRCLVPNRWKLLIVKSARSEKFQSTHHGAVISVGFPLCLPSLVVRASPRMSPHLLEGKAAPFN